MARARSRRESNLPAELSSFVGRRRELAEAGRLLRDHRLVTMTGPGGVGKTRLALRVADRARRAFPDGVYVVDLAGLDDHLLLNDTVLQALGVVDRSTRPAAEVLSEYLAGRRLLLVLDNCEHLTDACAWLVAALLRAAPELRVLATSREPLRVAGERLLAVPPAATSEAVELFEQRARAVAPTFAVSADSRALVTQLCQRLDNMPLAIELAAVRVRALSLRQILDRLDDRFRILGGPYRAGTRHPSLQAAMEWSEQTCSKPERVLWARGSVFAGDFALDAAQEVCSGEKVPRDAVPELLAGLVDKSILTTRRDGPMERYVWLNTLRAYGQRLLSDRGERAELRRRHRDWCLSLAPPNWARSRDAQGDESVLGRLLLERANLRAALDYCLTEPGQAAGAVDLAGRLLYLWLASGTVAEGRYWLDRALAADREPSPQRARALWTSGWLAIEQGDPDTAESRLAEAWALAVRLDDEPALAWTVALTGYAAVFTGDLHRARALLEDGLARHRALGNPDGLIATMSGLAQTTSYLGDPVSAEISEQALVLADQQGPVPRTVALRNLGLELVRQGQLERATELLRQALHAGRQVNQRYGTANCLHYLAWAAEANGQHERAAQLLGAADAVYRRIGATMPLPQRQCGDRYAAAARAALGDARFTARYLAGEQLTEEQAVDFALDRRAGQEPPPPAQPPPLSRREQQVAELVARGHSARDIADELTISVRTAEAHVAHILTKLGFTNRAQIAAWVVRQAVDPPAPDTDAQTCP